MNSETPDPQWEKTRELLRQHLIVPPLEHPDFINSQVLDVLGRKEAPRPVPVLFSLSRLLWAGAALLVAAVILSVAFLPRDLGSGEDAFVSNVIAARAENPQLSVTSFQVPDDRGVVLWIEGSNFIPATESVQ